MFIAAVFTVAEMESATCLLTEEWITKMYHSFIMTYGEKWMEIQRIILSEVTQSQKIKIGYSVSYVDSNF